MSKDNNKNQILLVLTIFLIIINQYFTTLLAIFSPFALIFTLLLMTKIVMEKNYLYLIPTGIGLSIQLMVTIGFSNEQYMYNTIIRDKSIYYWLLDFANILTIIGAISLVIISIYYILKNRKLKALQQN